MLIGAVILVVWLQQALTVRYILLRPDLAKLSKNRKTKFKLCGNAYSTLKYPCGGLNTLLWASSLLRPCQRRAALCRAALCRAALCRAVLYQQRLAVLCYAVRAVL